jgi:hypothetical protein
VPVLQREYLFLHADLSEPWSGEAKLQFQRCVRRSESCKGLLALNVYPDNLAQHYEMVSELNIICRKNRSLRMEERENEFKAATLNPNHPKYYESYPSPHSGIITASTPISFQ